LPRGNQILQKLSVPGSDVGFMSQLFLNRVKDLISIIHSDLPEIFLNTLSKSDLKHAYTFAYAIPARQWFDGLGEVAGRPT